MTSVDQLFAEVIRPEYDGSGQLSLRLEEDDKYWVKLTGVHNGHLAIKLDKFEVEPSFIAADVQKELLARCDYVIIDTISHQMAYVELKSGGLGNYWYQLIGGQLLFEMLIARAGRFEVLEDFFELTEAELFHVVLRVQTAARKRSKTPENLKSGIESHYVDNNGPIHVRKLFRKTSQEA